MLVFVLVEFLFFILLKKIKWNKDLSREESFNNLSNWTKEMKKGGMYEGTIVLMGNKSDLYKNESLHKKAIQFAKENKMRYFQVSAKTGENVEESIISTIKKIVSLYKERPPLRYHLNFERKPKEKKPRIEWSLVVIFLLSIIVFFKFFF